MSPNTVGPFEKQVFVFLLFNLKSSLPMVDNKCSLTVAELVLYSSDNGSVSLSLLPPSLPLLICPDFFCALFQFFSFALT